MSLYKRLMESDQDPLAEGVKVGDYVAARDGRTGYADRVESGMVYFVHKTQKNSENVVLPEEEVNVTTVEAFQPNRTTSPGGFRKLSPAEKFRARKALRLKSRRRRRAEAKGKNPQPAGHGTFRAGKRV